MHGSFPFRLRLVGFLVVIVGALSLIARLYYISVVQGEYYRELAERQYRRGGGSLFDRGSIFFTAKDGTEIRAATIATGATIAINPSVIVDPAVTYERLNTVVPLSRAEFMTKAGRTEDTYEDVARRVSADVVANVDVSAIEGTIVSPDRWRTYPAGELAAHALGFVGWNGDRQSGRYGLERYYEQVLRRDAIDTRPSFFASLFSDEPVAAATSTSLSDAPGDIVVTIEPTVQLTVERLLADLADRWKVDGAGAIVLDPKTGAVLALAARPSFDPNAYAAVTDSSVFSNPLVESVYEMGSIVKPLTVALGLDAKVITPRSTYRDDGFLELNGKTIRNFDGQGRGVVDMQEVLNQSLNTGAAHVALKLGHDRFAEGMHSFGIGEETGIDLPGESAGLTDNLEASRDVNTATASYGQGIAVTPIMMARALATLGNGGIVVNPHLISEIRYQNGEVRRPDYSSNRRALSADTSNTITRMLVKVVDEALLHGEAKLPRYTVAAKTGTAQIADPAGGYYADRYLHSFFGYFPAYDPRFLVFMYAVHPKGASYASQTMTEPFMDTARFLLSYYAVPPDR